VPFLFRNGQIISLSSGFSMKELNIKSVLRYLNFIIPFLYIAMGCTLFFNLFPNIDRGKRIIFGVVIILYGIFRVYKAYVKNRDMT